MEWFESLIRLDEQLFLRLNGIHSPFWDTAMLFFTRKESWLLLYLAVLGLIIRNFGKRSWFIVAFLVMGLVFSDQGTGIIKEIVGRVRPGYHPGISELTHFVNGKGGELGFPSSHASNAFFLFTFTAFLFRNRITFLVLLFWALLVSYTRIYTGVHYPLDVLGGLVFGIFSGWLFFRLLILAESKGRGSRKQARGKPLPGNQAVLLLLLFLAVTLTLLISVYLLHKYHLL